MDVERSGATREPTPGASGYRIEEWGPDDLPLLRATMGDARMTKYLGGPEDEAKLIDRQKRYENLAASGKGRMFKVIEEDSGLSVGTVGFWDKTWRDQEIYEVGWSVVPEYQGRGVASVATGLAIDVARSESKHRFMHAFPSVENAASNAICRKLGFESMGECDFEFPPGNLLRCNDWRLDLSAGG